ncbi:ankyrin repeat domain-containing protein 26-like [Synchiropus picturatus]
MMGRVLEFPKEKHPHALQSSKAHPVTEHAQKQLKTTFLGVWKADMANVKKSLCHPVTKKSHRPGKKLKSCIAKADSHHGPRNLSTTNHHWSESPGEQHDEEDYSLSEPLHSTSFLGNHSPRASRPVVDSFASDCHQPRSDGGYVLRNIYLSTLDTTKPVVLKLAPRLYPNTKNRNSSSRTDSEFSVPDSDEDDDINSSDSITWLPQITELDCPSSEEDASVLDEPTQTDNSGIMSVVQGTNAVASHHCGVISSSGITGAENEIQQVTLQLTEKSLQLDALQQEKDNIAARAEELEAAVRGEAARHEATQERLLQAQSESTLLTLQLEEAKTKYVEHAVAAAQESFSDILSKLRSDSEEKVKMVEVKNKELADKAAELLNQISKLQEENKEGQTAAKQLQLDLVDALRKLSASEASLDVNTRHRNDLEAEKSRLLKETDRLKGQLEESESQRVQAQRWITSLKCTLDEKDSQFSIANQKHQESLAALDISCSQLRLYIDELEKDKTELSNQVEIQMKLKEEATSLREKLQTSLHQEREKNAELREKIQRVQSKWKSEKSKQLETEAEPTCSLKMEPGRHTPVDEAVERLKEKVDTLQMHLEMESSHSRELEKVNRKLKYQLAQQKRARGSSEHFEQLERDVLDLKSRVETTKLVVEQYQRDRDKLIRQEVQQKLDQVNIFLQSQADCQDALDQVRAAHEANLRYQLEQKIQELECELGHTRSKVRHERPLNNGTLEQVDFEGSCRMWPPWSQQTALEPRTGPTSTGE